MKLLTCERFYLFSDLRPQVITGLNTAFKTDVKFLNFNPEKQHPFQIFYLRPTKYMLFYTTDFVHLK